MITKEQAMMCSEFYHVSARNADGTPLRCRANGKCKMWKTRPDDFRLPVKYGLRDCFYITPRNAADWTVSEPPTVTQKEYHLFFNLEYTIRKRMLGQEPVVRREGLAFVIRPTVEQDMLIQAKFRKAIDRIYARWRTATTTLIDYPRWAEYRLDTRPMGSVPRRFFTDDGIMWLDKLSRVLVGRPPKHQGAALHHIFLQWTLDPRFDYGPRNLDDPVPAKFRVAADVLRDAGFVVTVTHRVQPKRRYGQAGMGVTGVDRTYVKLTIQG